MTTADHQREDKQPLLSEEEQHPAQSDSEAGAGAAFPAESRTTAAVSGEQAHAQLTPPEGTLIPTTAPRVCGRLTKPWLEMNLFEAAQRGVFHRIRDLLDDKKATPNDVDPQGVTALHYAALGNHDVCLKYLIDRGATVDQAAGDLKATALHWATRSVALCLGSFAELTLFFSLFLRVQKWQAGGCAPSREGGRQPESERRARIQCAASGRPLLTRHARPVSHSPRHGTRRG